jgi:hypothetical protein
MGILLAFIAGIGSLANFMTVQNQFLQIVLTILSVLSMIFYQGRRSRKSYNFDGTRIFTLGFSICVLSFMGSASILAGFMLHLV